VTLLDIADPRWRDFVESQPRASIFHHPAWATVLADTYGYRAMAIGLVERGGSLAAGLPVINVTGRVGARRWVSLPFTDMCPLLEADGSADGPAALIELSRSARLDVLELRGALPEHADVQRHTAFVRHELPLVADHDVIWQGLRKNHRRSIRDAERAGVTVVRGTAASDIETFYRLHVRTRRRLGVPVQPLRFFRLLHERVIQAGLGFVLTARAGQVPVAASVFSAWNGTVTYKYGARDERLPKLDANHLLFWTAIRTACKEGYRAFDLGRSDIAQLPLRSFKTGWGAREEPLPYSWIARSPVRQSSHRAERAVGLIIRNSSPWVCRAIGELLYKYAA
jgi:CelD/BcsL family acetyltransferase involved in cellulose biosynthesis